MVRQALADARELQLDTAESQLFVSIDAREAWAICFFLKTRGRERGYVERQEVTGPDGGAVQIDGTLSWAALRQLARQQLRPGGAVVEAASVAVVSDERCET